MKKKLSEQSGGFNYNLHHRGGNIGEAKTAARSVSNVRFEGGMNNWFNQVRDWSIAYERASTDQERNDARNNINGYIGEINAKFAASGSETRFYWQPQAHWQAGARNL